MHLTVEFDEELFSKEDLLSAMNTEIPVEIDVSVLEGVWVVTYDREQNMFDSNDEVLGVFSSEKLATLFKVRWLANWDEKRRPAEYWVDVDEWKLDEVEL